MSGSSRSVAVEVKDGKDLPTLDVESSDVPAGGVASGVQCMAAYHCRCGDPSCDVALHPAKVLNVSRSKKRALAPVRVSYTGYGSEHDAWLRLDEVVVSGMTPEGDLLHDAAE